MVMVASIPLSSIVRRRDLNASSYCLPHQANLTKCCDAPDGSDWTVVKFPSRPDFPHNEVFAELRDAPGLAPEQRSGQ
jgi:hypothetical protein